MAHSTPQEPPTPLLSTFFGLLADYRRAVRQERVFVRLAQLSIGAVVSLGRHTVSQMLVALGVGSGDWSAWYRLFNRQRVDPDGLQSLLVAQVVEVVPVDAPAIVVGVDGTQLPRSTRTMPGSGYTVNPRSPKWQRGIHFAQRFVCISLFCRRARRVERAGRFRSRACSCAVRRPPRWETNRSAPRVRGQLRS